MTAQLQDLSAAQAYLSRDPHVNRELLIALRYEPVSAVRVARRGSQVIGALVRGIGPLSPRPEWVRLDADDAAAVQQLLQPEDLADDVVLSIHRPWIGALVAEHYGIPASDSGIYGYLAERSTLSPQTAHAVRALTLNDAGLVERSGCGWSRSYFERLFHDRRRPWAIIKDGLIVCRASSGYPHANSEEVVGVWTHERWRTRGLAQALVSVVAADILERVHYAAYTTTYDNIASQCVAQAVGFELCFAARSHQRQTQALNAGTPTAS